MMTNFDKPGTYGPGYGEAALCNMHNMYLNKGICKGCEDDIMLARSGVEAYEQTYEGGTAENWHDRCMAQLERNHELEAEVKRLQGEVHDRNKRALEGDKSAKALDDLYEAHESLRVENDSLKRSIKNHGRGEWCYNNECMICTSVL